MGNSRVLHNLKRAIALASSSNEFNHEFGCTLLEGYLGANKDKPQVYKLLLELYMILCKERTSH